jgi:arylsulfatase
MAHLPVPWPSAGVKNKIRNTIQAFIQRAFPDRSHPPSGNLMYYFKLTLSGLSMVLLSACSQSAAPPPDPPPNILYILADDMGYSDIAPFGGEIETPHLDQLARDGIRFSQFYNASRCCPTRAALLTGQYPHQAGMGCMVDWPPNAEAGPYQGYLSQGQVTIASALKPTGYQNYMVGKWHLGEAPEHWPLQYGFDRYFGLISGASSYFELIKNQKRERKMASGNERWEPPADKFYMTTAFSDTAVSYIQQHNPEAPFFLYLAYTAPHWPIHALEEDISLFEERYLTGWDKLARDRFTRMQSLGLIEQDLALPPKPGSIPDWDTLSKSEQREWARRMAVYAAMIYRMDVGIGQVIQALKDKGLYERTAIVFVSDNGATDADISRRGLNDPDVPIGRRGSYTSYLEPWAWVSNIPYQKYKKSSYWGGMRTPCIISYPKFTKGLNAISRQEGHVIDLLPTALGLAGAPVPEQYQAEGIDLSPVWESQADTLLSPGRPLFLEHMGNKAVIAGEWKLLKTTWTESWALFDLSNDPLETVDLSSEKPKKAAELMSLYSEWEERTQSHTLTEKHLE